MEHLRLPNIGRKVKNIRIERGLTLEQVSSITKVSKTMLGQIERNESIPTITTLWKIASGLRISMSDLLSNDIDELKPHHIKSGNVVYEAEGKVELYPVFPFSPATGFEYFYIMMKPGAEYLSGAHENATEEYIVVTTGTLNLILNGGVYVLKAPSSFQFIPNTDHFYLNSSEEEVIFQDIVKY